LLVGIAFLALAGPGAHADSKDQHDGHDGGDGPEHEAEFESNSIDATLDVYGLVSGLVEGAVVVAGLAALVDHLHARLEHGWARLLPVLPLLGAAAAERGLHVVPEERGHRVPLVHLVVRDGLLQLALGHLQLVTKVEEHDEDPAGRRAQEHKQDDDVGPEHASVCAGGAAASEEGEYEEEAEDGDDDEDEREVHCRRVSTVEVGHDLEVEDLLRLQQEVNATANDGQRGSPCQKIDDEEEKLRDVDAALAAPRGAAHGGGSGVAGRVVNEKGELAGGLVNTWASPL